MPEDRSVRVGWKNAVEAVLRLVRSQESLGLPVVGVTGRVSAGKSTLAQRIAAAGGGLVHTTDDAQVPRLEVRELHLRPGTEAEVRPERLHHNHSQNCVVI